ncbi:MAG: hypothetical protein FWD65_08930 [Coriobacteriia bacterium]|nr:hypothetical protein [Coriobacteriia bacterium]
MKLVKRMQVLKRGSALVLTLAVLAGALVSLPAFAQAVSQQQVSADHVMGSTIRPDVSAQSAGATAAPQALSIAPLSVASATPPSLYFPNSSLPRTDAVDVASYQSWMTQADFNALAKAGVKYVVVKLTEGTTYTNPYAAQEITYAKGAGIKIAAYHYVDNPNNIVAEAQFFAARAVALKLPKTTVMIEDAEGSSTGYNWTAASASFAQTLKSAGFPNVRFYCSLSWVTSGAMNATTLGAQNMWIAQYQLSTPSSSTLLNTAYGAWQFSSLAYFSGMSTSAQSLDVSIQYQSFFFYAPAAPVLVSATAGASSVTVTWKPVSGVTGYYLYRKAGSATSWTRIATLASSVTSYADKAVSGCTNYTYTLRAYKGATVSGYNATGVSATFVATPNLVSVANGAGYTKLTWSKVAGVDGYRVYRKTASTSWVLKATVKGSATVSYSDKTVASGTSYIYTVRAYKGANVGGYKTAGITIRYLTVPVLGSAKRYKTGYNSIKVTWSGSKNADGYYVYRKSGSSAWVRVANVGTTARSWVDATTKKGVTYTYTVRAWDKTGTVTSVSSYNATGVSFKP